MYKGTKAAKCVFTATIAWQYGSIILCSILTALASRNQLDIMRAVCSGQSQCAVQAAGSLSEDSMVNNELLGGGSEKPFRPCTDEPNALLSWNLFLFALARMKPYKLLCSYPLLWFGLSGFRHLLLFKWLDWPLRH